MIVESHHQHTAHLMILVQVRTVPRLLTTAVLGSRKPQLWKYVWVTTTVDNNMLEHR